MKKLIALFLVLSLGVGLVPAPMALAQSQVLNLQDADIRVFIQDVAQATGQTFIIDPRVQGKVSISSREPLSRNELFEVMLSTLRANGLVAVPAGSGVYRITPEDGAAAQPSSLSGAGGYGFSTQVFRLRNIDAVSAAETLKPLIGRQGVVMPSPRGNLLVVADYADNLARIRNLLAQVDQDRTLTETITLKSSSAREIAGVVNQVLNPPGAEPAARNAIVSLVVVESSNSLILRGEPEAVRPMLDLIADLDGRAEASGDVRVINLQHASAEQLLPVLQQLVGQTPNAPEGETAAAAAAAQPGQTATAGGMGRRANIARYPGANAIVIAADPDTQRVLGEVIRQLDTRRRQVLVEAVVVELSDNAAQQLGVQFALAGINGSSIPFSATNYSNAAPNILGLAAAAAGERNLPEDSSALAALRQAALESVLGARGVITGGYGQSGDALFGFIINAVKNDTASNLLSTPSVMTLDNQEASILVGQEIPITTGEVLGDSNNNPFRTIQRQNVGIQLDVKPQINAGGAITLYLRQEVSSISGPVSEASGELILDKRAIETTVAVDDGAIVVLGGLLDRNERSTVERTPFLGDIPGLGNLFKATSRQNVQRNLMVFIRPTIINSAADAQALTAPRYGYIRDLEAARSADGFSNLDALVRDYMQAAPITAPAPGL
ncbi:MAG: type II secretion system secretin GspD [Phenylobacterium sp.]|uniref:type II secretion system secretin GspD n=1 Tax=Phenylobacterium sp. TaxID=1871053 RepID=UPI0025F664E4|nr:type II secretion system secretin GspD [Phenylobacterium sp.]MCG9916962.1 type II secretion system secretin GspD [Phenylobacterium sp.]